MNAVLAANAVSVRFGGVTALDEVSFTLAPGELLGLIGPNGAGKSTLMRVITGVVRPDTGGITLNGEAIDRLSTAARVRRGLGMSQQLVQPFRTMTVLDNVVLAAGHDRTRSALRAFTQLGRAPEQAVALRLLRRVGIEDSARHMPGDVPLGVLKRLELARALAVEPKVLLLDEPLAGLNHVEARTLADTIKAVNGEGLTVILIEHNLGEVLRTCSRLIVLDNGRVIAAGDPDAVMALGEVQDAYMGRTAANA